MSGPMLIGRINYYGDIKEVRFPSQFSQFCFGVSSLLCINQDELQTVIMYYKDSDGDEITINNESDYHELLNQVKSGDVGEVFIKFNENLKKKQVNNNNQMYGQVSKEQVENQNNMNMINQNAKKENSINNQKNIQQQNIPDYKNNNIAYPIGNISGMNPNNNNMMNMGNMRNMNSNMQQQGKNIRSGNLSANIQSNNYNNNNYNNNNNFNNIQNFNNIPNNFSSNSNNNNVNIMSNNSKQPRVNVISQVNSNLSGSLSNIGPEQFIQTKFETGCCKCNTFPIIAVLYFCPKCNAYLCQNCEEKIGFTHEHPLFKIRNNSMLIEAQNYTRAIQKESKNNTFSNNATSINENNPSSPFVNSSVNPIKKDDNSSVGEFFGKVKDGIFGLPTKIKGLFDNTENKLTDVQKMRNMFQLGNFTDTQIEVALNRANGNYEEAAALLVQQGF